MEAHIAALVFPASLGEVWQTVKAQESFPDI